MVNVLDRLAGARVNRRAARCIPVEQIRRTDLVWPLAHQHHLTVRSGSNVLGDEILTHTRSHRRRVPRFNGFNHVRDSV